MLKSDNKIANKRILLLIKMKGDVKIQIFNSKKHNFPFLCTNCRYEKFIPYFVRHVRDDSLFIFTDDDSLFPTWTKRFFVGASVLVELG